MLRPDDLKRYCPVSAAIKAYRSKAYVSVLTPTHIQSSAIYLVRPAVQIETRASQYSTHGVVIAATGRTPSSFQCL